MSSSKPSRSDAKALRQDQRGWVVIEGDQEYGYALEAHPFRPHE